MTGIGNLVTSMVTSWIRIPMPSLIDESGQYSEDVSPVAVDENLIRIGAYLWWFGLAIAVLCVVVVGVRMVLSMRSGDGSAAFGRLGWVFTGAFVISSASSVVGYVLTQNANTNAAGSVHFIQVSLFQWTAFLALVSVMIASIRTMWNQRGQDMAQLGASLLRLLIVAVSAVTFVSLLDGAFNSFTTGILGAASECDMRGEGDRACLGQKVTFMLVGAETVGTAVPLVKVLGVLMVLLVMVILGVVVLLQIAIMIFRSAIIVLLTGMLPLATSFTNTEMGMKWFKNITGWLLAALLYKPVVALIIAAGLRMSGTFSDNKMDEIMTTVLGLTILLLSVVAMPALMKLCVPAVAQTAGAMNATMMATSLVLSSGVVGGDMVAKHFKNSPDGASSGGGTPSGQSLTGSGSPSGALPGGGPGGASSHGASSGGAASGGSPASAPAASSGAGSIGASGAGAASGAGSGAAAGASGAAAAAGPAGVALMAADKVTEKVVEGAKKVAETTKATAEGAIGSGEQP